MQQKRLSFISVVALVALEVLEGPKVVPEVLVAKVVTATSR
jgi:hypothetical protein